MKVGCCSFQITATASSGSCWINEKAPSEAGALELLLTSRSVELTNGFSHKIRRGIFPDDPSVACRGTIY